MALVKNVELWFAKLDPSKPSKKFNKTNPTWELQIRTKSKDVKKEWEALGLKVKAVIPDEGEPFYRVNLRKKSIKGDGEPSSAPSVVGGKLEPINPNSIGNGSIGNVRIYQYEYNDAAKGKSLASVLMGVQITKHIVYEAAPRDDDFEEEDMEVVEPEHKEMTDDDIPY